MSYILDILVIGLFALFIYLGYRKGFVRSIVQLAGCIAALAIALAVSAPLAGGIYDAFLSDRVCQTIDRNIPDTYSGDVREAADAVLDKLPGVVVNALKNQDLGTPEQIAAELGSRVGDTRRSMINTVEQEIVRPLAVSLLSPVCCLAVFLILLIAVFFIARIVNKMFQIPGLKQINHSLGAITGVIQGIIFILIAVMVLSIVSVTAKSDGLWSRDTIEKSIIVSRIENVNPLSKAVRDILGDA